MKPTQFTARRTVCAFTALLWTTHLTAQEAARSTPPPEEEIRYGVQSTRILPDGGRKIILQRVSPPVLSAPPSPRLKLPSTLQELTALANAKADRTTPFRSRLVVLNVTAFPGGITNLEWLPKGGGFPFAAWSNADFRLMSLVPDFEIDPGNTRYSILQFGTCATFQPQPGRPPLASAPSPVSIPAANVGAVQQLNLNGQGFRSIQWVPSLNNNAGAYLIIGGPSNGGPLKAETGRETFTLYQWNGPGNNPVVRVPNLRPYTQRPEGVNIITMTLNGQPEQRLLFVEDRYKATGYGARNAVHWPTTIMQ
jgi:hypothetical protein